jgi:hypothetical protein
VGEQLVGLSGVSRVGARFPEDEQGRKPVPTGLACPCGACRAVCRFRS